MAGLIFFWSNSPCVEYTDRVEPIGLEYVDIAPASLVAYEDLVGQNVVYGKRTKRPLCAHD